jgi:regulator of sirC expression with transglutaminase-like and TPR domain
MAGTQVYYDAFAQLNRFDSENYSLMDVVFLIENAYYDNKRDFQKLKDNIIETGILLKSKMNELKYDTESNTAKNLILFQYFSEDMKFGNKNHKAFKYDFEDFWGVDDYSKMFVSKLMNTGTGQCHSLPLLYLMLAEQIGAEAYLSFSPNHSYIRFPDDDGNIFSLELTNGMFSTNSFVLQSGYVKSEALLNKIYMQELSKQELLSQMYAYLAGAYLHKYGYDEFIGEVLDRSLELYPNNINARMYKANYQAVKFEYAASQLGIDPYNPQELQNISYYPNAVKLLNEANRQVRQIDNLGYQPMPAEAYINWLKSVHAEKEKQKSKEIHQTLKATQKPTKKKTNKIKHDPKKKEEVKQKIFH